MPLNKKKNNVKEKVEKKEKAEIVNHICGISKKHIFNLRKDIAHDAF